VSLEKRLEHLQRRINRLKYVTRIVYRPRIVLRTLYETITLLENVRMPGWIHQYSTLQFTDKFEIIFATFITEKFNMTDLIEEKVFRLKQLTEFTSLIDMLFKEYQMKKLESFNITHIYVILVMHIIRDHIGIIDSLSYVAWMFKTSSEILELESCLIHKLFKVFIQQMLMIDFMKKEEEKVLYGVTPSRFDISRFDECGFDFSYLIFKDKVMIKQFIQLQEIYVENICLKEYMFKQMIKKYGEIISLIDAYKYVLTCVRTFTVTIHMQDLVWKYLLRMKTCKDTIRIFDTFQHLKTAVLVRSFAQTLQLQIKRIVLTIKINMENIQIDGLLRKQSKHVIFAKAPPRFDQSRFNECQFDLSDIFVKDKMSYQCECGVTCETVCQACGEAGFCETACEETCQTACEQGECQTGCEVECQTTCEQVCETFCKQECQTGCMVVCQYCEEGGRIVF